MHNSIYRLCLQMPDDCKYKLYNIFQTQFQYQPCEKNNLILHFAKSFNSKNNYKLCLCMPEERTT